ncbi:hypothetical protein FJ941_03735 [Mesorhizobium sp. B2-3-13]|uniref:hypothetical protein n=1 Tax=Mesorhizobium sp. B2-3-13 TaxID=2589951 RepID=UPI001126BF86|nr:hypothetical protein [Mesorhizobium sp. B2-3-13]TPL89914.1 hypothetical protein FJ941_03735 [Mesorhizobium sp. B2-3-13]
MVFTDLIFVRGIGVASFAGPEQDWIDAMVIRIRNGPPTWSLAAVFLIWFWGEDLIFVRVAGLVCLGRSGRIQGGSYPNAKRPAKL